jgi:hypothetical protein
MIKGGFWQVKLVSALYVILCAIQVLGLSGWDEENQNYEEKVGLSWIKQSKIKGSRTLIFNQIIKKKT